MATWSIPLRRWSKDTEKKMDLVARKAIFDLFSTVVRRSPVDTGRFRANWNISYGSINPTTTEETSRARIKGDLTKLLSSPVNGVIFMTNSLPYAKRLEEGWSKQAPVGMVRITAAEWNMKVKRAIRAVG